MSSSKAPSPANDASKSSPKRPKLSVNPSQYKRRLENELRYLEAHSKDGPCKYKVVTVEAEQRLWNVLFLPNKEPYNVGAFRMIIDFSNDYPFHPPLMTFKTKTYHPNIGENGNMELGLCNGEAWKPAMRIFQICDYIFSMLNYPEASRGIVRKDIAELMTNNREAFNKEAAAFSKKHCEARI